jgi:hypothetical protein
MKNIIWKKLLFDLLFKSKNILFILIIFNIFNVTYTKFNIEYFKDQNIDGISNLDKNTFNGPISNFRFSQKDEEETHRFDNLENFVQKKVRLII